jgi:hypothetical protein
MKDCEVLPHGSVFTDLSCDAWACMADAWSRGFHPDQVIDWAKHWDSKITLRMVVVAYEAMDIDYAVFSGLSARSKK